MVKNKIIVISMICILVFTNPINTYAAENTLDFGEEYLEETEVSQEIFAVKVSDNEPSPCINSDGSFTVEINSIGYVLKSDKFKVSDTTCRITMDAGAGSEAGSEYYVILMKDGIIDTKVKKVTYYTGGVYYYDFTDLSTSSKYYLKIDSNHTSLNCYGTISNYVAIEQ